MTVSAGKLLDCLPPYEDVWIEINPDQNVRDIIIEVLEAHQEFAPYYDNISSFFEGETVNDTCDNIYFFLKSNITYREETPKDQTSALPAGILTRGYGDCKHYSGFAAGILDALCRQGKKIDWCYRFASYKFLDKTPHHVFIVVNPGSSNEIWIDPTPGAETMEPVWEIDKNCKMALRRNIAGISDWEELEYEELDGIGKRPFWQLMPAQGIRGQDGQHGTNPYFSGPFLALEHYKEDPYSVEGTNWQTTANAINAEIAKGPSPGHSVDADFVKWIYDNSIKGWNFYYDFGVTPGYRANLPADYPHPVITEDFRLTFDRDQEVDDYMNDKIHALYAWIQDLINTHDSTPYPIKPRDIKLFSQNNTGMPGNTAANLFNEHRGKGFFKEVGEFLEDTVNVIKQGVLLIVGSIPRNAFLGLVAINAFNFAGNLWEKIQAGKWESMAKTWKSLGGNPDKLRGTIEDGKGKKAILGTIEDQYLGIVPVEPVSAGTTTLLAAAAPIIAAMLAFINDKDGKIKDVLSATKGFLQTKYPDIDLTAYGFLDKKTGQPIQWQVNPQDDENFGGGDNQLPVPKSSTENRRLLYAAAAGVGVYLIQKNKKNLLLPAAAAAAVYFINPRI